MHPLPHRHRSRNTGSIHGRFSASPIYLVRAADHVPDIEMMMERHRIVQHATGLKWLEHLTIQRVAAGFMLYAKLSDAGQMSHHPEYASWTREALPMEAALGAGWREISQSEVQIMLDDSRI